MKADKFATKRYNMQGEDQPRGRKQLKIKYCSANKKKES